MQQVTSKKRDAAPEIIAAGKVFETPAGGITAELQQEERPPTPTGVQPFRKSFYARVGKVGRHYGLRKDAPPPDVRFGRQNEYESSTAECLNPKVQGDKLNALSAANAEKNYLSSKREPLGRTAIPLYEVPERAKQTGFGVKSDTSESAKSVIYSCANKYDEVKELHPAGEQKQRKYNWAKVQIDPTKFRFGSNTAGNPITTKELFTPPTSTHILPRIVHDQKNVTTPQLGKTRNFGFGDRAQDVDFHYGKSMARDKLGTRELLSGLAEVKETESDLGKPVCRSATLKKIKKDTQHDENRVFGCPTVRLDLRRPKNKKVTDANNYGDDVGASSLLYPNLYMATGVDEDTFGIKLNRDQALGLAPRLGLTEEDVSRAYAHAAKSGPVSFEGLRVAIDDLKI